MPEEFDSIYRVIGFGDEARRMGLYDIPRDDTVWVNTIGYEDEIRSVLETIESGNVIEAIVTDEGDENDFWNLLDIEIVEDTALFFVPTDGYLIGPTDDLWDAREAGKDLATAGRRDEETDELMYEVQVQKKEIMTNEGEAVDVYENLQRGELLTEPLFDGTGCDFLPDGSEVVLIVNAEGAEYLAMYLFPERNDAYEQIWGSYYDYVDQID